MVVLTVLFFGALIGGIVAMIAGLSEWRLGQVLTLILCGGWSAGFGLGRLFGWSMFASSPTTMHMNDTDDQTLNTKH